MEALGIDCRARALSGSAPSVLGCLRDRKCATVNRDPCRGNGISIGCECGCVGGAGAGEV